MVKRILIISLALKMLKSYLYLLLIYISPKNTKNRRDFDETKYISFLIKDN